MFRKKPVTVQDLKKSFLIHNAEQEWGYEQK
jgi:hypothetical protein